MSLASAISVQLLQDAHRVLHHLLVGGWRVRAERLDDLSDVQIFKGFSALSVHTQVANREQSDAARRLAWALVVLDDVEQLLQRAMLDQVLAQSVGVADEIAERTSCIGSSLLLLVPEQVDQEHHARPQVLVKHIIVEASITNGKAGELTRVPVGIPAALNRRRNQPKLKQFFIEEASMAAKVSNQVANLGANIRISMRNQDLQVVVNVRIVDRLVEVLVDSGELRDQGQGVHDQLRRIISLHELVLCDGR